FVDDGILGGDPETVLKGFCKIKELFSKMGLEINPAKCELFFVGTKEQKVFDEFSVASPGIQIIEELTLFASPVIDEAISSTFCKKLENINRLINRLSNNNPFKIAIGLRLGLNLNRTHTCLCEEIVLPNSHHGLSCKRGYGKTSRHQRINEVILRTLNTAGYPSTLEPPRLSRTDNKCPDGMTRFSWSGGKPLVWDFTCINTLALCYTQQLISKPGSIAELAAKYVDIEEQGYSYVPIAVETMGPWSLSVIKLIKDIGYKIKILTDDKRSTSYLIQRISLEIQRGNASCVLNTFPPSERLNEIFYL
ncbi:hypothetical protein ILUMI_14072, partial [Ignelater luminosus]